MANLNGVSAGLNQYGIYIEDDVEENKREHVHHQRAEISSYPTPNNIAELRQLISCAELESDPEIIAIYDRALAPYFRHRLNLRDLVHDDVRHRFFCLNFPVSKTNLIGTLNPVIKAGSQNKLPFRHPMKDDQNSALSALLKEECTENRLSTLRNKSQNNQFAQTPSEFVEAFSESRGSRDAAAFFIQYSAPALFYYFLFLLNPSGDTNKSLCSDLFSQLSRTEIWTKLSEEEILDFTWLILHYPPLLSQLQRDPNDQVQILCEEKATKQQRLFTTSRFLISAQSNYFSSLLTNNNEPIDTLDLSSTSFDSRTIELLLRWISHSRTGMFAFDGETTIQELKNLIESIAALDLSNQKEFEEAVIIELKKRLNVDTLYEITQIGLRYHLHLLIDFCVRFINFYEEGNLYLKVDSQGFFEVTQSRDGYDLPEQVYKTISLLGPKIHTASIETFRPQTERRGCCTRIVNKLSSFSHSFWDKCGGLVKRTGCFALSIFSIEKMADKEWIDERDFPLAVGLGIIYPLVHKVFSRCVDCSRRNRPVLVVSLPGLIPLRIQYKAEKALLAVQESVHGCAQVCFRKRRDSGAEPLISAQNPIFNALPSTLHSLKVSQASDLTDEDCAQIGAKYPELKRLELGYHPCLNGKNFQFLARLNLQELSFVFRRGEKGLALELLRLDELISQSNLKIEISLFDTTLIYFPPTFLRNLPLGASLHVLLQHAPIPPGFILFESPTGAGQSVAWPGVAEALSVSFPKIDTLDCHGPLTDADLELISPAIASCRQLILRQGPRPFRPEGLTDIAMQIIGERCQQLEELFIGISSITTIQALIDNNILLKKIAFRQCNHLDNSVLDQLARMPTLSSIYIDGLHLITDLGLNNILDNSTSVQECLVMNCNGVSHHMLMRLFYEKNPSKKENMKKAVHALKQIFDTPLPKQLAQKLSLPLLFGSMQTMAPQFFIGKKYQAFHSHLGLVREKQSLEFPLSLHEASAQFSCDMESMIIDSVNSAEHALQFSHPENASHKRIKKEMAPFNPLAADTMRLFALYCLSEELTPYRYQIASAYREFLAHYFSSEYLLTVDKLVTEFMTHLKDAIKTNENDLKKKIEELIPLAFLNPRIFLFRTYQIFFADHSEVNQEIFLNFAQLIKTQGDTLGWTFEQRITPLFAAILFNLNFFSNVLLPTKERVSVVPADFDKRFDSDEKHD